MNCNFFSAISSSAGSSRRLLNPNWDALLSSSPVAEETNNSRNLFRTNYQTISAIQTVLLKTTHKLLECDTPFTLYFYLSTETPLSACHSSFCSFFDSSFLQHRFQLPIPVPRNIFLLVPVPPDIQSPVPVPSSRENDGKGWQNKSTHHPDEEQLWD